MLASDRRDRLIALARDYFVRGDAGRADVFDLFTDDVQIYFPKMGVVHGKPGFQALAEGLIGSVSAFAHLPSTFTFFVDGDTVIVEGTTTGEDKAGNGWRGGETPGGRFCSVFVFENELIARMHIYLDPDYTSQDTPRFLWGRAAERSW